MIMAGKSAASYVRTVFHVCTSHDAKFVKKWFNTWENNSREEWRITLRKDNQKNFSPKKNDLTEE